jgi:hypothetical protein
MAGFRFSGDMSRSPSFVICLLHVFFLQGCSSHRKEIDEEEAYSLFFQEFQYK